MLADFWMEFYTTGLLRCYTIKYTLLSSTFLEVYLKMPNVYWFNHENFPFCSHSGLASSKLPWVRWEESLPQTLQILIHWTITSGAPCWKSTGTINSSRSPRLLMSWRSLCRPSGTAANFTKRLAAYMAANCVTLSICSNSVQLQVCILISAQKKTLFSEPLTFQQRKQHSKC